MKPLIIGAVFFAASYSYCSFAQNINTIINAGEVEKIERVLSSDAMQGRKTGTPGNEKAAAFIAAEFKKAGLQTWNSSDSYLQRFSMVNAKTTLAEATFDGTALGADKIIAVSVEPDITVTEQSGYAVKTLKSTQELRSFAGGLSQITANTLVLVDSSLAGIFPRLQHFAGSQFKSATPHSTVLVLAQQLPAKFTIHVKQAITEQHLMNVVGVIPGKSKKNEYVIFSGHYDHLGITNKPENGDSIYNGANDDAAGTTGVIMLARYFKAQHNNERTLVFAAFTAEEIGGYGSQYFSKQFSNPADVMAMFNIEMIGTESKWGRNSAYITGYEKTDMGKILEKNLQGSGFTFYPDPYTDQQLFYRSDNATLARLGVPAHTISTSKMDNEPNYHKLSDEIGTLDMKNMAEIIKAVAISSTSIIEGKDTPSRVDTGALNR
ncbi:M20/M25/M40 family metallo-hydrolase [Deminuibacter soli]|uniref:M20/M25/M40 family metallo-hydrolase n=1 Tax=Deminuibacter soli TaxID=2291815 RepID=A0A3E1NP69_9BACT|nr:M20/M25/M40 family metallo-hydrolase [Deminuibacter soli]RFM29713.1 M20/M25/M40 family metallo-hydrolase [Deminuibacter soli]